EAVRRRYWARSVVGWAWLKRREPNAAHYAVAELERRGIVAGVVTQNVDGLHQASGSRRVIDLHGRLARAICLDCGAVEDRDALQERMLRRNPGWDAIVAEMAPDGDADLEEATIGRFEVPGCTRCGGVMKPDVVFFGENVPRSRVDEAFALQHEVDSLLVLGSSLAVFSGFRFVLEAHARGQPVAIVNRGKTRGDRFAAVRIDASLEETLATLP
ncbi:MAG: Sir2 family NAD-dependent protein deacetylase, partial [Spirochaetales bacterium]